MDNLVTAKGRLVFPSLAKPKKDAKSGKEYYLATLLFKTPEEIKDVVLACKKHADDKFGKFDDSVKKPFKKEVRDFKLEKYPFLKDMFAISFKTLYPPTFLWGYGESKGKPIMDVRKELYSGCYVHVSYSTFDWAHESNGRGIGLNVHSLLKVEDGEKIGYVPGSEFEHLLGTVDLSEPEGNVDLESMFK